MRVSIATAPSCWGVERGHDTHRPGWELVLDEVAAAGYSALELGPAGYIPLAPRRVGAALHMRRLHIVAGTVRAALRPARHARADLDDASLATVGRKGGPRNSDGALRDTKRSRDFLKAVGLGGKDCARSAA